MKCGSLRKQAKLCGLTAMDALLLVMEAGNWPGKAQKKGMLLILMPEKALGRGGERSEHRAGSNVSHSF